MNVEVVQRRLWERSQQHRKHRESDMPLFPVDPYDGRARSVTTSTYGPTSKTCSIDYWRDRRITNPFVPTTGNSRTRNRFAAIASPSVETAPTASSVVAFSAAAKYSARCAANSSSRPTPKQTRSVELPNTPSALGRTVGKWMVLLGAHGLLARAGGEGGTGMAGWLLVTAYAGAARRRQPSLGPTAAFGLVARHAYHKRSPLLLGPTLSAWGNVPPRSCRTHFCRCHAQRLGVIHLLSTPPGCGPGLRVRGEPINLLYARFSTARSTPATAAACPSSKLSKGDRTTPRRGAVIQNNRLRMGNQFYSSPARAGQGTEEPAITQ